MKNKSPRIPRIPYWLLQKMYTHDIEEGYMGDIKEEFDEILKSRGRAKAVCWIWIHSLKAVPKTLLEYLNWGGIMFKNYLKITLRIIKRRKGFSLINISGLVVGMVVCLLLLQYVTYELSYENFHENIENIYRLHLKDFAGSHGAAGKAVKETFPEVMDYVKFNKSFSGGIYSYQDRKFQETKAFFVRESFFKMFSFPLLKGDPETSLSRANTAVLTKSTAERYFGNEDPIGKLIRYQGGNSYEITGIVEDVPGNSHLHFDILISYKTLIKIRGDWIESTWISCPYYTYLYLKPGTDIKAFAIKIKDFFQQKEEEIAKDKREDLNYELQPLRDIHLFSNLDFEIENNGDGRLVYFLAIVALSILAIAWINYINLSIAKSLERAKEIGIRKVIGALRGQLIKQFLSESFLFNLSATVFATFMVIISLSYFNQLTGIPESFLFWHDFRFWLVLIMMFFSGTLLSGLYPAYVLSSFRPTDVLKGKSTKSGKGRVLRKCLVVFQFCISLALIAGTLTVYKQISFMRAQNLGVNIDQTLVIRGPQSSGSYGGFLSSLENFKTEAKRIPEVHHAAVSTFVPGEDAWVRSGARRRYVPKGDEKEFRVIGIDHDFIDLYQLEIIAGGNFSENIAAEYSSLIINESALALLEFKNPEDAVGEEIFYRDKPNRIIGVIKNFHQESLKENYEPLFLNRLLWGTNFSLKVSVNNLKKTISSIQASWNSLFPGYPFEYFFLDDHFDRQYKTDRQFGKTLSLFAFLAIFIGCLGLLGLSSYETVLRTKEIGIRKVLGAPLPSLLTLLLKDITVMMFCSIIIALPISYFYFHRWLGNYAFRIDIGWWFFFIPTILVLGIASAAVSYNTIKVSLANPVDNLRYE